MAYSAMLTFLPAGMLGLMVAGLLAAYVSTLSTHLNWGTSYLVHDMYRRFINPAQDERHYVMVGRVTTGVLMVAAALFTLVLQTAKDSFDLLLSVGAGTGLLYLLRWFWWRINAWSEIAAMASSFLLAAGLFAARRAGVAIPTQWSLILTVAVTTVVWLTVAFVTDPTDRTVLQKFYRTVRPPGRGWQVVRAECGGLAPLGDLRLAATGWLSGCALVYSALFGAGHALLGHTTYAAAFGGLFVVSTVVMARVLSRLWAA